MVQQVFEFFGDWERVELFLGVVGCQFVVMIFLDVYGGQVKVIFIDFQVGIFDGWNIKFIFKNIKIVKIQK